MSPTPATGESCEVISKSEGLKAFFFFALKVPTCTSIKCISSLCYKINYFSGCLFWFKSKTMS